MSVNVTSVTMADFAVVKAMEGHSIGIFEAAWISDRKVARDRSSIFGAMLSIANELPVIYHITVNGSDDAEDFVIDQMHLSDLPAIAVFSHGGKIEYKARLDVNGALDSGLFSAELKRVKDRILSDSSERVRSSSVMSTSSDGVEDDVNDDLRNPVSWPVSIDTVVSLIFGSARGDIESPRMGINMPATAEDLRYDDSCSINSGSIAECLINSHKSLKPLTLFISGDKSSVGKSSTCLAVLASLIRLGVDPSLIAYIKPVTQCEAEQPVTDYCSRVGITHCGVGPVVFYKGFTRAYLRKETMTADTLKQLVVDAVNKISVGKRIVIVDGVGYPSVGSICNLSNADIAQTLHAPVLLIGKAGVGDAVDSFNMNARFFESYGVTVLGAIFNKLPLEGFYSLQSCKEAVTSYFEQYGTRYSPYGFIPLLSLDSEEKRVPCGSEEMENGVPHVPILKGLKEDLLADAFLENVDFGKLLFDLFKYSLNSKCLKIGNGMTILRPMSYDNAMEEEESPCMQQIQQNQNRNIQHNVSGLTDRYSSASNGMLDRFNVSLLDPLKINKRRRFDGAYRGPTGMSPVTPNDPITPHTPMVLQPLQHTQKKVKVQLPSSRPMSREEIEALAFSQGAKKGG